MDLADWFKGFEKGIAKLPEAQRETFFRECGKNCVQCGTLQIYKDLYKQAAGDLDQFFAKANELPGVRCETIEKGSVYDLYFMECTCGLHKQGYVSTPLLCECSKQSILYVLQSLWKDRTFQVTICESILRGSLHCRMRIEAINTDFAEFETKI